MSTKKLAAEAIGTFWLTFAGCGSAVIAAGFPNVGLGLLGLALAANLGLFEGGAGLGWLHAKLLIVLLLSGFHGWAVSYSRKLAGGHGPIPARRLRMLGELPALAVILIVILAVVKPF